MNKNVTEIELYKLCDLIQYGKLSIEDINDLFMIIKNIVEDNPYDSRLAACMAVLKYIHFPECETVIESVLENKSIPLDVRNVAVCSGMYFKPFPRCFDYVSELFEENFINQNIRYTVTSIINTLSSIMDIYEGIPEKSNKTTDIEKLCSTVGKTLQICLKYVESSSVNTYDLSLIIDSIRSDYFYYKRLRKYVLKHKEQLLKICDEHSNNEEKSIQSVFTYFKEELLNHNSIPYKT